MSWEIIDQQMRVYRTKLMDDFKLDGEASSNLATAISIEINALSEQKLDEVLSVFLPVSIEHVFEEITAFQQWMVTVPDNQAAASRARVIVQNYICFLYLRDACFAKLSSIMREGSIT